MIFEMNDVEEWNIQDFINYVIIKINALGIPYKINIPTDYIIVGKILKKIRTEGMTKYLFKKRIDDFFENKDVTDIHSLIFLWRIFERSDFLNKPETLTKCSTRNAISPKTIKKLRTIKKELRSMESHETKA